MTKNETIHVRVNEKVKDSAEATLDALGISISEAINMFLCQVSLVGGLPFDVRLPVPERVRVNTRKELEEKLDKAQEDISEGRVKPADEVFGRLEKKYDL